MRVTVVTAEVVLQREEAQIMTAVSAFTQKIQKRVQVSSLTILCLYSSEAS